MTRSRKAAKNVFSQSRVRRRKPCCRETVFVRDWLSRPCTSVTGHRGRLRHGSVATVVFNYFADNGCVTSTSHFEGPGECGDASDTRTSSNTAKFNINFTILLLHLCDCENCE